MAYFEASGLGRDFPGVTALDAVDLSLALGRVHVLAGENGAGKSTLVKLLTGTDRPSRGRVTIDGRDPARHPELFRSVAYVPQELTLFPLVSVAENLFLPFDRTGHGRGLFDSRRLRREAGAWLDRFGIEARPDDLVRDVSVSDQQLLQIARAATSADIKVLILDEPTSALTQTEVDRVFRVIRDFRARDVAVVFISHKMDEIFDIGDDYTVLRNGGRVGGGRLSEIDEAGLIRLMSGRHIAMGDHFRPDARPDAQPGRPMMEVEGLTGRRFENVSFTLRQGEILGLAGLVGAGRSEVMQTIFGFLKARSGRVTVEHAPWRLGDTAASVKNGMLYLSEERKHHGIFPLLSLRENVGLSILDVTSGPFGIDRRREHDAVGRIIDEFGIRTAGQDKLVSHLSGGNQQKAIIGRAMATRPRILIFDEPTKGIDVGTKAEIYRIMKGLAEDGIGIILVSSEMAELRRCASRILTMHAGRVTGDFDTATTDTETLVAAIFGREHAHP